MNFSPQAQSNSHGPGRLQLPSPSSTSTRAESRVSTILPSVIRFRLCNVFCSPGRREWNYGKPMIQPRYSLRECELAISLLNRPSSASPFSARRQRGVSLLGTLLHQLIHTLLHCLSCSEASLHALKRSDFSILKRL
ncbi:hypothetical protein KP509_31G018100 [Ceratopteris richardii]|uniref:Uncharacterized protein n=1 Tax=Ceratopteris richardii TaxID=49495 RepID=A0A8T2QXC4_CERRI|nr:hypothetical protein KP509_31G018100 [Ceratopteris richardii]